MPEIRELLREMNRQSERPEGSHFLLNPSECRCLLREIASLREELAEVTRERDFAAGLRDSYSEQRDRLREELAAANARAENANARIRHLDTRVVDRTRRMEAAEARAVAAEEDARLLDLMDRDGLEVSYYNPDSKSGGPYWEVSKYDASDVAGAGHSIREALRDAAMSDTDGEREG